MRPKTRRDSPVSLMTQPWSGHSCRILKLEMKCTKFETCKRIQKQKLNTSIPAQVQNSKNDKAIDMLEHRKFPKWLNYSVASHSNIRNRATQKSDIVQFKNQTSCHSNISSTHSMQLKNMQGRHKQISACRERHKCNSLFAELQIPETPKPSGSQKIMISFRITRVIGALVAFKIMMSLIICRGTVMFQSM